MSKKIIVLIEIIVCIMAIVVVSLFGLQAENWRDVVYVTSIAFYEDDITMVDSVYNGKEGKYLQINLQPDDESYQIKWRVAPENATNSKIIFTFSGGMQQENGIVTDGDIAVTPEGWLYFPGGKAKSVDIIAKTTDGSNKTATLRIRVSENGGGVLPL